MPRLARCGPCVLWLAFAAFPSIAAAQAVLSVSPTVVNAEGSVGTNLPAQTVQITNNGNGSLKWSIDRPGANWLSVSPTTGIKDGTVTLTFLTSQLFGMRGCAPSRTISPRDLGTPPAHRCRS